MHRFVGRPRKTILIPTNLFFFFFFQILFLLFFCLQMNIACLFIGLHITNGDIQHRPKSHEFPLLTHCCSKNIMSRSVNTLSWSFLFVNHIVLNPLLLSPSNSGFVYTSYIVFSSLLVHIAKKISISFWGVCFSVKMLSFYT